VPKLRLSAELRYQDEENKTEYTAVNPLTGEYGYPALDGGLGAAIPPRSGIFDPAQPGSRVRFRNVPFEKDTLSLGAEVDYRLSRGTKLIGSYHREEARHRYRERRRMEEDRFGLQLTHRRMGWGTVRLSYQYADRRGDEYNSNPYEPFFTSSLPEFTEPFPDGRLPHTLSALRKFDLASRAAQSLDAKINIIIGDRMDLMLSGRYEQEDFAAEFGLQDSETIKANLEMCGCSTAMKGTISRISTTMV
jgi:hypothetical protein